MTVCPDSGEMHEKSPFTFWDFLQQRKRWIQGIFLTVHSPEIPIKNKVSLLCYFLHEFKGKGREERRAVNLRCLKRKGAVESGRGRDVKRVCVSAAAGAVAVRVGDDAADGIAGVVLLVAATAALRPLRFPRRLRRRRQSLHVYIWRHQGLLPQVQVRPALLPFLSQFRLTVRGNIAAYCSAYRHLCRLTLFRKVATYR